MLTPAQYTTLKSELQTDPKALGYAPNITVGNDQANADLLNKVGASSETLPLARVSTAGALAYMVLSEFLALPTASQQYLAMVCASQELLILDPLQPLNPTTNAWQYTDIYAALTTLFPTTTTTGANIAKLVNQPCSRVEALLHTKGISLSALDVAKALRG